MTSKEVRELLRISPRTLRRWEQQGKLTAVRLSYRVVRYTTDSVLELLHLADNSNAASQPLAAPQEVSTRHARYHPSD